MVLCSFASCRSIMPSPALISTRSLRLCAFWSARATSTISSLAIPISIIRSYFDDSYLSAVSSFVKEEKISVDELRELINQIENQQS